ncbi:hypothetical protein DMN91_010319 [Ooceraea biroi]|uniref:Borealin n=1 Tax=Ooceraea biroi TaxID=2015173 RepID=A0A026WK79_OOCBI|nr:borealin isoform X2 [Ooceraea biroi]XP_011335718.1 borealin isoform X2 [Ooceraea biroi]XP_019886883.1 borealin isoform X2 [Ooceraea biroi]XP_026829288.1 borealin isoform X2 [Ooceraea biroi]XP_026829289.1 borealin isoform X2 [Ooceraea biroi]EZA56430.1 Borealin [Ooceraea biroi]RLU18076.1 hypothetical protein DMN91_010319 [Ooceraea biroi]
MPRTKYTRKKTSDSGREYDMVIQTFDRHLQQRIAKLERETHADVKSFETFIDVVVSRLPAEVRQMMLSEVLAWQAGDQEKENYQVSSSVSMQPPATALRVRAAKKGAKRATAASDDGYATGGTSMGSAVSRATKAQLQVEVTSTRRSTRSSTRAAQLSEVTQTVAKPSKGRVTRSALKVDNFKTPAMLKTSMAVYGLVTPKIKPNTPLNVLRRPRQGEMVLSMQGSPLLVSAVIEEKIANINVPLANGNVMSLLPQEGLRMSNIPQLDPETMHQLATLKSHIEKVIKTKDTKDVCEQ